MKKPNTYRNHKGKFLLAPCSNPECHICRRERKPAKATREKRPKPQIKLSEDGKTYRIIQRGRPGKDGYILSCDFAEGFPSIAACMVALGPRGHLHSWARYR